ncbi:hypothetical protein KK141_11310 [Dyella sp. LX-66]|uniref:hypothetical protein n=1 Tax=unclassified Dyella TaxID=2634549 RepID=UPI001BDFE513|nr:MULTISPECIES: hypothetical protein [unclassified Dyella]MBT2118889.1 hypothetical protein [Dyella sp. LX-1]MBT2140118.1 hypothetical protein [Dyella sp. LX-66]
MKLQSLSYLAIMVSALALPNAGLAADTSKCTFGEAQRDKIVDGMSYDQAVKILGCKEKRTGSGEYTFYEWKSTVPRNPNEDPRTYPGVSAGMKEDKLFGVTAY